jgi:hypothetical protein
MEHLLSAHAVHTAHFDNIFDLEGFFQRMRSLVVQEQGNFWTCPVSMCRRQFSCSSDWGKHVAEVGHNLWNTKTIPELTEFVLEPPDSDDDEDDDEQPLAADSRLDEAEDGEEEDEALPVECVFCSAVIPDIFLHCMSVHGFDLSAVFTGAAKDHRLRNDYDVIRVVNALRHAADESHQCLHCGASFSSLQDWTGHIAAQPAHTLPTNISALDDQLLIPRRPHDYLIPLLLELCESDFDGEVEPDYPLVSRVVDFAERDCPSESNM